MAHVPSRDAVQAPMCLSAAWNPSTTAFGLRSGWHSGHILRPRARHEGGRGQISENSYCEMLGFRYTYVLRVTHSSVAQRQSPRLLTELL